MSSLIIKNGTTLTKDGRRSVISNGAVYIDKGLIMDISESGELLSKYSADEERDARGNVVMPGLVNTHIHLFQSIGKG